MNKEEILKNVKYDNNNLVVCVIQDYHSKHIRMVAYMNKEALEQTLRTGQMTYFSRSRNKLWVKGETSGYFQYLKGMSIDCDGDALLFQVEQVGGISCHTGNVSCFYRDLDEDVEIKLNRDKILDNDSMFINLENTIKDRINNPKEGSYTNYLIDKGENKILKKVGEESTEAILAFKDGKKEEMIFEISDLIYHLTVEMSLKGISWNDISEELKKR